MRIGINALYMLPGKVGGTEIYLRNLVSTMADAGTGDEILLFVNRESAGVFDRPGITVVPCPVTAENRPQRILWEQVMLPRMVRQNRVDVLLSAGMTAPVFCKATSVLVILDLQHVNQPQNFPAWYLCFLRSIIYASAVSADGVIAISGAVRKDIEKHYRIPAERICAIHLGVDHEQFSATRPIRKLDTLPNRYILYAASSLPHKNHERLLQAFARALQAIPDLKLVLIGARDRGRQRLVDLITKMGLDKNVIMLGWVPMDEIPDIFRSCEAFVYPTLHEGFGLPVIEAMASGVPVVCSRIEPLNEIAGDAAIFVDPYDPEDITRGIVAAVTDERLRTEMIDRGISRSRQFTWEATGRQTLSFLKTIHALKER
jgi:glycosyltransferase involved in cell wall biosynthesis